jgi:hypothetical protein
VRTPTEVAAQIWCRPELAKTQMDAVLGTAIAEEIQEARIEGARLALKAAVEIADSESANCIAVAILAINPSALVVESQKGKG